MKNTIRSLLLAALALALIFSFACSKNQEYPALEHNILHFYSANDDTTVFFADDKKLPDRISGSITTLGTVDGLYGFVVAAGSLYRIDTEGLLKIYPAAVTNVVAALNGGKLLFATATMAHIYDESSKSYEKLEGIEADGIVDLALSPNGTAAGVTVLKDEQIVSYVFKDGRLSEKNEGRCIVALSDNADICYYLKAQEQSVGGVLHFVKNGKDSVITENASPYFELNRDLSEITFDVDGSTHFSRNGSRAKRIVDSSVLSFSGPRYTSMGGKACTSLLKNTNTLLDGIFYSDITSEDADGNKYEQYNVYYVDSSLHCSTLVLGASQFSASADRKSILTVVDNSLYSVSAYNPKKPELVAGGNIYTFCCSRELDEIHFLDMAGNVYRIEDGKLSPILVTGMDTIKRMKDGTVLCYTSTESGGTLFALKGDKASPIAVGVEYFEVYEQAVAYLANFDKDAKSYELYLGADCESFTSTGERVILGK